MTKVTHSKGSFRKAYQQIKDLLLRARGQAWQAVNVAMVTAYWNIGRIIVGHEQKGKRRAEYGRHFKLEALRRELSWP